MIRCGKCVEFATWILTLVDDEFAWEYLCDHCCGVMADGFTCVGIDVTIEPLPEVA